MPLPVLSPDEQRVLGSLLEKQRTVPGSYPLSLNSLRLACNQTSSRDPITDLDDRTLEDVVRELKGRGLLRVVWAGKGSRTLKYHQLLDSELSLQPDERALMLDAMVRGVEHDGELLRATQVRAVREGDRNSWVEVVLDEGRNRQIRRMLEAQGIACLRLVRVSIGDVVLGDLEKGAVRALTDEEVAGLRRRIAARRAG